MSTSDFEQAFREFQHESRKVTEQTNNSDSPQVTFDDLQEKWEVLKEAQKELDEFLLERRSGSFSTIDDFLDVREDFLSGYQQFTSSFRNDMIDSFSDLTFAYIEGTGLDRAGMPPDPFEVEIRAMGDWEEWKERIVKYLKSWGIKFREKNIEKLEDKRHSFVLQYKFWL